jgi:hypothetical protein
VRRHQRRPGRRTRRRRDGRTRARAAERETLIARLPELARAQERLAKAVTNALVADDEVLLGEVKGQYQEAKQAAQDAQERLAELEGVERDLRERRAAIEHAGEAMASWVELLGRAEVEPEHLAAARKFLGALLVGPIAVSRPITAGASRAARGSTAGCSASWPWSKARRSSSGWGVQSLVVQTRRMRPVGWVGHSTAPTWPPIPPTLRAPGGAVALCDCDSP